MARNDWLQNIDRRPRKARQEIQRLDPQAAQLGVNPRPRVARQTQQLPAGNMNTVVDQGNTTNNVIEASVYSNVPNVAGGSVPGGADVSNGSPLQGAAGVVRDMGKPFDPNKNALYKQLAEYQANRAAEQFAARGMEYSTAAQERMEQVRMNMGLEFEDRALRRQQTQLAGYQTLQNMGVTQRAEDVGQYGLSLSPQTRELTRTAQTLTPEEWGFADQYSQNFAGAMQNLDEGSREYQILNAARFQKVMKDPVKYADYLIADYGMSPKEVQGIAIKQELAEASSLAESQKEQAELDKLMAQADKAQYDAVLSGLKAAGYPEERLADLRNVLARTEQTKTATELTREKLQTEMAKNDPRVPGLISDWLEQKDENQNYIPLDQWLQMKKGGKKKIDWLEKPLLDQMIKTAKELGLMTNESDPVQEALAKVIEETMLNKPKPDLNPDE